LFLELSKDELFAVMKNLVYTFNWAWIRSEMAIAEEYSLDAAAIGEQLTELFREFGSRQARKLVDLSIISGTDVDSIIKGFQFSHWSLFENIELTRLSDSVARMRTIDCSLQRNSRAKWGMAYPCKNIKFSSEWRIGFAKGINSKAEVKCSYCTPDPRSKDIPENVSCEWIIKIPS
jgi:hypothetical protein